jgi:hypothetical protein
MSMIATRDREVGQQLAMSIIGTVYNSHRQTSTCERVIHGIVGVMR